VLGYEGTLVKMAKDPEFVEDMFSTFTDLIIGLYEILESKGLKFDVAWFNSDVCYGGGMLFSSRMYERMILPLHQRLTAYFKARDMPTVFHTCGNVRQIVPLYMEAGVRGLHPLEGRAGNDVRELRRLYGDQMVFIGNISADRLSGSKEDVEAEISSKVTVAKEGGAYVFCSDHSIPPTVSLENYRYALQLAEEYGRIH
jgi:uroporphyrinogen decarboxylase